MTFKEKYGDHSTETYNEKLDISYQKLDSLEGCYKEINDDFSCAGNILTSLKYAPKIVNGDFDCYFNKLTSLEGAPKTVKGDFDCADNKLISMESAPTIINGKFYCTGNPKLKSIDELLGTKIKGELKSDIITDKEFKEDNKLFIKVGKNISKFKKLKELIKAVS